MKNWVKIGVVSIFVIASLLGYKMYVDNVKKKQSMELEHKLFQMEMREIDYMDSLERSMK